MATVPPTARVVVIGAGIVGNSLVHHLARLGWRDIVQIDKGPLPQPRRLDGARLNFIFPVDHCREITDLTLDCDAAVQGDGRLHRVRRLRGRAHRGADGGAAPPDVLGAGLGDRGRAGHARVRRGEGAVPRHRPVHRGFWTPTVGVVDSLRAGTIMRESALESGALTVVPTVEVVGLDTEEDRPDPAGHPRADRRRHRAPSRGHRVRGLEPEDRRTWPASRSR